MAFTAFSIALLLFFIEFTSGNTLGSDVIALEAIRSSILQDSIHPASCVSTWDFSFDPCSPASREKFSCGLTCDASKQRITKLELEPAGYRGSLSTAIGRLSSLQAIDLSQNSFTGTIPAELGNLHRLEKLDLSANSFKGAVPSTLASLSMLKYLDLSRNQLTRTIPEGLFSGMKSLERLHLEQNQFTGQLPPSLAKVDSLRYLDASYNQLSGGSTFSNLPTSLLQLSLRSNKLSGSIDIQKFKHVEVMDLSSNTFSGSLPASVFSLSSLQQFNISRNHITSIKDPGNSFDLRGSSIVAFDASHNRISGGLPSWLPKLRRLSGLYLSYNLFSGSIPIEYAQKSAVTDGGALPLARLFLDGNYLRGEVPVLFKKPLSSLISANFAYNCLTSCSPTLLFCKASQRPQLECKAHYGSS